jgi:hypothetical protein
MAFLAPIINKKPADRCCGLFIGSNFNSRGNLFSRGIRILQRAVFFGYYRFRILKQEVD